MLSIYMKHHLLLGQTNSILLTTGRHFLFAGAPTNIYIHSLDSSRQLSSEIQLLKDENVHLQAQLKRAVQGMFHAR